MCFKLLHSSHASKYYRHVYDMSSQLFIATCGSQYAFHLVHHPLPGFELGTPTTDRLWPHFDQAASMYHRFSLSLLFVFVFRGVTRLPRGSPLCVLFLCGGGYPYLTLCFYSIEAFIMPRSPLLIHAAQKSHAATPCSSKTNHAQPS